MRWGFLLREHVLKPICCPCQKREMCPVWWRCLKNLFSLPDLFPPNTRLFCPQEGLASRARLQKTSKLGESSHLPLRVTAPEIQPPETTSFSSQENFGFRVHDYRSWSHESLLALKTGWNAYSKEAVFGLLASMLFGKTESSLEHLEWIEFLLTKDHLSEEVPNSN